MGNCTFMSKITEDTVVDAYINHGYELLRGEYLLNIFGVRSKDMQSNTFNDCVGVLYQKDDQWHLFKTECTTDAGLYYRLNPMNINGTGIIAPGQHKHVWKLGKHKQKYEALVQVRPMLVFRDANRNDVLEYIGEPKSELAGINLHRANAKVESKQVDKWSAACVVVANPNSFQHILELVKEHLARHADQAEFNFTLFEEKDF